MKIREKLLSVLIRWFGAAVHPLRQAYRLNVPQVANPVNTNDTASQPENATATSKISGLALSKAGEMAYHTGQSVGGLPQLPVGVLPEQGLAQDAAALQLAQDNAAFCFAYANSTQGGMGFKGYPVLAELSQRSEYRSPTETLATEMTRQWISFKSTGSENRSEQLKAIEAAFDQFKIRDKLKQAVEHDGFFGRGMLFVDMGDAALNSTPLIINPATIKQGGLKGFKVIEPMWTSPSQYNAIDPTAKDFYQPSAWYVMGKQVHASRLLLFIARPLPDMLKPAYNFSGLSMTQLLEPAVNAWLRTRDSVSELVHSFSTSGLKTDMQAVLAGGTGDDIINRAQFFNQMRDNRGLMLLDKDNEEFFQFHTPLGGLDRLQAQAQEQMAAPSHIPLVKLFGITPNGLNASSEGEIKVFYDYVQAMQQTLFTDPLVKLLQIIQLHLFGEIYDDITFEYRPLEQMNDEQELNISKGKAEMGATLIQAGVISKEEERQRLAGDPLSGYDGLSALLLEDELPPNEQKEVAPAQDAQVKDAEFERLHPRAENGEWTKKGQGVPLKGEQPKSPVKKKDNIKDFGFETGYTSGYPTSYSSKASSNKTAMAATKPAVAAKATSMPATGNRIAAATQRLPDTKVLSLKKKDYEAHASYFTYEDIQDIDEAVKKGTTVSSDQSLHNKLITLLGKKNVQLKYEGVGKTRVPVASHQTLVLARKAFIKIGNGNLPGLIGFPKDNKQDKTLIYQSFMDAMGNGARKESQLKAYKDLYTSNFVDLTQGASEGLNALVPDVNARIDRQMKENEAFRQFSEKNHTAVSVSPPFRTKAQERQYYFNTYMISRASKDDAPAWMRREAKNHIRLGIISTVPWFEIYGAGASIAKSIGTTARIGEKADLAARIPKQTIEQNGKRFSRKFENGHEPDNELWSHKLSIEKKENNISFDNVYLKAPAAKIEIDNLAQAIANKYGGKVAKAPLKSKERALQKVNKDYGGDASKIKDLARNTIIVDSNNINKVVADLNSKGADVKVVSASSDELGYSGINATILTNAGIRAEMQVNTPTMIFAKESEVNARILLGDNVYNQIANRTPVQGGLGHKYYEEWRVLDRNSDEAKAIAQKSRDYYDSVRNANDTK